MRGKAKVQNHQRAVEGITPAHAGKRVFALSPNRNAKDHPRPCGEKLRGYQKRYPHQGSPPPMRGKAKHYGRLSCRHRITPAHAGKSMSWSRATMIIGDHPRPCGEKMAAIFWPP